MTDPTRATPPTSVATTLAVLSALVLAAGCGGGQSQADEPDAPEGEVLGRSERLDLEILPSPDLEGAERITLLLIDETGSSRRIKVDDYRASCRRVAPESLPEPHVAGELLAAVCTADDGGLDLRFVMRRGQLILLESRFQAAEDPRAFEERNRFPLPSGAKIEAAPIGG